MALRFGRSSLNHLHFVWLLNVILTLSSHSQESRQNLNGKYLGMEPPGLTPQVFAPGIISTEAKEFALTFTRDMDEMYFTRSGGKANLPTNTIMVSRQVLGQWKEPEIAWFSGTYFDFEPHITPDGRRMYFGSRRPLNDSDTSLKMRQWYLERIGDKWSSSTPVDSPISNYPAMYISVAGNGNIYFSMDNEVAGIWMSKFLNGRIMLPEKLPEEINHLPVPLHPYIASDESYILFDAKPNDTAQGSDIFVSFRNQDGKWRKAVALGPDINVSHEMCPSVSPDGKYIFFTRDGDIYWICAKVLANTYQKQNYHSRDTIQLMNENLLKPKNIPLIFEPEILKNVKCKISGLSFSPDFKELFFTCWNSDKQKAQIMYVKQDDNIWSTPAVASFSGKFMDWDCNFSPDGRMLLFSSLRPKYQGDIQQQGDLWYVKKDSTGTWSNPGHFGNRINSQFDDVNPTICSNGTIYFFISDSLFNQDIFMSERIDDKYSIPLKLCNNVNSEHSEMDPFIDPDETYIIFHSNRPGGFGGMDLYISFKKNGSWSKAVNLGPEINTVNHEYGGRVTFDNRFLFYNSTGTERHIYWVSTKSTFDLKY